jgi:hypothetical protein
MHQQTTRARGHRAVAPSVTGVVTAVPKAEFLTSGEYIVFSVSVAYTWTGENGEPVTTTRQYGSQLCAGLTFSCAQLQSHVGTKLFRDLQEFALRGFRVTTRNGYPFTVQDVLDLIDV